MSLLKSFFSSFAMGRQAVSRLVPTSGTFVVDNEAIYAWHWLLILPRWFTGTRTVCWPTNFPDPSKTFYFQCVPFSSLLIQNGMFVEALSFPSYKVLVLLAKLIK
jgi:hypothetical protein